MIWANHVYLWLAAACALLLVLSFVWRLWAALHDAPPHGLSAEERAARGSLLLFTGLTIVFSVIGYLD
jgi:hypothetical protein